MVSVVNDIFLELGDIIQIEAPRNEELHDKIFLIDYISNKLIKIIDDQTLNIVSLDIENNKFTDESIVSISILDKADERGYVRQNGLLPGKWVNIHFGGDMPTIITGEISDIENDMIELTIYPSNEKIYIDFAYQGINYDLIPIDSIKIREAPKIEPKDVDIVDGTEDIRDTDDAEDVEDDDDSGSKVKKTMVEIPVRQIKEKIQDVLTEADEIVFGDDIEEIQQEVFVDDENKRYALEEQTNDLLDEMLSTIPNIKRTKTVLNNIHLMINRFTELRRKFSEFDINGNIIKSIKHGNNHKPLVNNLLKLDKSLYWLLPVVRNSVKLYNLKSDLETGEDVIRFEDGEELEEINKLQENYKNKSMDVSDHYGKYIKSLNPYLTPYDIQQNAQEDNETIITQHVNANMDVVINNIVSNLNEFYTHVNRKDILKRERFVITKYNLGLNRLEKQETRGSSMISNTIELTKSDKLPLRSILTLPEPYIIYSQIQLPSSSIYNKTNLNHTPIAYWRLLRKNTSVTTTLVNNLKQEKQYDPSTFLQEINNLVLNDELSDDDKYKKFLQVVIPKTSTLFDLVKKYITRGTSFHNVVSYLEAFGVYKEDITYKQYQLIVEFINAQIDRVRLTIAQNMKDTNILRELKTKIEFTVSSYLELINKSKTNIKELYELNLTPGLYSGEFISKLMNIDYGKYYNTLIAVQNKDLMNDIDVNKMIQEKITILSDDINKKQNESTCKNYILSKKYTSIEELNKDERTTQVFFDEEYDHTFYGILEEYRTEQASMTPDKFHKFLTVQLLDNFNGNEIKARNTAETIINGKKMVKNGDYAVLEKITDDSEEGENYRYYYLRENNNWILKEDISEIANTDENRVFCNIRPSCAQIKDINDNQCESIDTIRDKIEQHNLQDMAKSIIDDEAITKTARTNKLNTLLREYEQKIKPLIQRLHSNITKSNDYLYNIGLQLDKIEIIESPYSKLRDMILSKSDIVEKVSFINKFVLLYTRPAKEGDDNSISSRSTSSIEKDNYINEDPNWLYCIKTNTKLLPTFYVDIADSFVMGADMNYILDKICAERGEISDDGDKWVDKHSGYTIKIIEYSTDEGYDEQGFKIQTNDILTGGPIIDKYELVSKEDDELLNTPQAQTVKRVIYALSFYTGIEILEYINFIIKNVTLTVSKQMPRKEVYDKKVYIANKKGKKMISYEKKYNQLLLFFSALYFLIVIQTSIPGIRTKKTFPGCKKSFDGFPTFRTIVTDESEDKDSDYSGLEYIACVLKKISSTQSPWDSIKGIAEKSIVSNLITIFNKLVSKETEIQKKIIDKINYIQEGNEEEFIPEYAQLERWNTFLPPIQQIKTKTTRNISAEFRAELKNNVKNGDKEQEDKMNIISGKIIYFTINVMDEINKIVKKESALLENMKGEPFLQNVCCNDEDNNKVIDYFVNKHPEILKYIDNIKLFTLIINNIQNLSRAPILYSNENTKTQYPLLSIEYSETTIYQAFIKNCKINKQVNIPSYLQQFCVSNESSFKNTDTLKEKIAILKGEGKKYNGEMLNKMLKIISRENIQHMELYRTIHDNKGLLKKLIKHMDDVDSDFSPKLRDHMYDLLKSFDIMETKQSDKVKDLRNYLLTTIKNMKSNIKIFLNDNINTTINKKNKLMKIIDNFMEFKVIEGSDLLEEQEETTTTIINFIKNIIQDLVITIPNMILNKVYHKNMDIPKHWKLSNIHQTDIKNLLSKNNEPLEELYGKDLLKPVFNLLEMEATETLRLMDATILNSYKHINGKKYTPLLNSKLVKELYNFYVLDVITKLIDLQFMDQTYLNEFNKSLIEERKQKENGITEDLSEDEYQEQEEFNGDLMSADTVKMKRNIADLLGVYLNILQQHKKHINYNRKHIIELVLRSREKEKDMKTRQLKDLTDEERKADGELRKGKLGRWNVGLQKGLTQYVKGTYDAERVEMENEALINNKLNDTVNISDMNRDIYAMDMLEDEINEREIENEAMDMTLLPDDDDYGDNEGDEQFY